MEDLTGVLAIIFIFGTPAMIALIVGGFWWNGVRSRRLESENARQTYERLMTRKLDVIETAMSMGFSREELGDLDARLEQLIGAEKMAALLDAQNPAVPPVTPVMQDADLVKEVELQRERKQQRA